MRQGRHIILCAGFFIAGNFFGGVVALPAWCFLAAGGLTAFASLLCRRLPLMMAAIFLLGAAGLQAGRMPSGEESTPRIVEFASRVQADFSSSLSRYIPEGDELAVMRALAVGDKSSLTRDIRAVYRQSGAMHLLALSGLHVGIIYALIAAALSVFGGSRPVKLLRSIVILSFLWFYALVSGMSPSISRAVIMITLFEISGFVGTQRDGPSSVAASALLITLFSPESPRDIGFQLSYSAVIAIYTIYPRLRPLLQTGSRVLRYVWDSICIALSCQCTCGVLGWIYFGTFPRYFLLTNIMAVPLATIVMYLIAITLLTSTVPALEPFASHLLQRAIHLLNELLSVIASL